MLSPEAVNALSAQPEPPFESSSWSSRAVLGSSPLWPNPGCAEQRGLVNELLSLRTPMRDEPQWQG
jgi:hypothetical protein